TNEGPLPIEIFGKHNMNNLAGAKWICQHMGIDEEGFYEAIPSFKGASKRLEKLADNGDTVIFKDFAHSPSKVMATTQAVKEQYPDKKLIACLELHTYSSLNPEFLKEYYGALNGADLGCVYYSPEALKIKRLDPIDAGQIKSAFGNEDLLTHTDPESFKEFLDIQDLSNSVLLLMSSGNYGGLDLNALSKKI
ncbi:MAG: peptidoglycan synthetase, partial [Flavobacteriaceae bacterium]|nr:peptidoglycan synthetase [Flavobacteriaceae bacterium]